MRHIIFSLCFSFSLVNSVFAQNIISIQNEYFLENFSDNGIIFFNSTLETRKFKKINLSAYNSNDYWHLLKLSGSNMKVQSKLGIVKVDINDLSKNNHTLILKFQDHKHAIEKIDTIDLPYFIKMTLENRNFVYQQENKLEFSSILSDGKKIEGNSLFLNVNDICSCNKDDFYVSNGQIVPKYDNKTLVSKQNLCLKRFTTNDTLFNEQVNFTYKDNYYVNFSGKNGQNGQRGVNGSQNSAAGTSGTNGTNGEDAPGVSVFVQKIIFGGDSVLKIEAFSTNGLYFEDITNLNPKIKIVSKGGEGGFGGSGGSGQSGQSELQVDGTYSRVDGGNGGNGGNAGAGGNGGSVIVYLKNDVILQEENFIIENAAGKTGNAGSAGVGASGSSGFIFFNGMYSGKSGSSGLTANDGQNSNFAKVVTLEALEFEVNYKEKIKKMFE